MYLALGEALRGPGAAPADPQDLREEGQSWWLGQRESLAGVLCPRILQLKEFESELQLVEAVADLILIYCNYQPMVIPPLALLVVKLGVKKLCPDI